MSFKKHFGSYLQLKCMYNNKHYQLLLALARLFNNDSLDDGLG